MQVERTESEGEGHPTVSPDEGVVVEHGVLPVFLVLDRAEQEHRADFYESLCWYFATCWKCITMSESMEKMRSEILQTIYTAAFPFDRFYAQTGAIQVFRSFPHYRRPSTR